jgi:2'-5' RNA ligase
MQKRLFAAIKIEPDKVFGTLCSNLKKLWRAHKINWVPLNNMHITMHFFGETDERRIAEISFQLRKAVEEIPAFELKISGIGIFGSCYKPRVIWMGIETNESINLLARKVAEQLNHIGYIPDRQNFVPHLTIGRIKYIEDKMLFQQQLNGVNDTFIQTCPAEKLLLFESKLSSEGPNYHIIETFNFSG